MPDYDEEDTRKAHASHDLRDIGYGRDTCAKCGMRGYWPGIENPCRGRSSKKSKFNIDYARAALKEEVDEFFKWWASREEFDETLPSMNDWGAEFHEWRK